MIEFRREQHFIRKTEMIEVWIDGRLMAAVYPNENGDGIRVMSRHVHGQPLMTLTSDVPDMKSWEFKLTD
jgi:hypothetical protein